jgi:aminobenzoyl-glutamate utilization protein B
MSNNYNNTNMNKYFLLLFSFIGFQFISGQNNAQIKSRIIAQLDAKFETYKSVALDIWDYAELGFLENKSTALLTRQLEDAGFKIEKGVAGMPTAFIAEYGDKGPVIGFLAEYDALPAMSQAAEPSLKPREEGKPGHACGHHMFGTASVAAAIAVKNWLAENKMAGTIRLYGTPAEEGGGGKVFMVREGLFDDVDAVLTWHPGDANTSSPTSTLSAIGGVFTFKGIASHAARFPERGRSALDGVEAMNHMVNLLREHIPMESRIHYTISNGGGAANVVPASASVAYIIRHPEMPVVKDLLRRVKLAAEGAASGTETTVSFEVETGYFNILPNSTLAKLVHDNLSQVGGVTYSAEETAFAEQINESFAKKVDPLLAAEIMPYDANPPVTSASTDVGDISWVVPTTSFRAATWVPGTAPHSWQAVAAGGTDIGMKGMMVAAKTLTTSAIDLYLNPDLLKVAKSELLEKRGTDFKYESLLGDISPPLNYRKNY